MFDTNIFIRELLKDQSLLNWDAITISILVVINIYYLRQIKKQINFVEIDRFTKEMENLVAPLYSEIREQDFLSERWLKSPVNQADKDGQEEFDNFWHNIEKYKYLTSPSLRVAIDNYRDINHISMNYMILNSRRGKPIPNEHDVQIAKETLHQEIVKRYGELQTLLSNEHMNRVERLKIRIKVDWPFSRN